MKTDGSFTVLIIVLSLSVLTLTSSTSSPSLPCGVVVPFTSNGSVANVPQTQLANLWGTAPDSLFNINGTAYAKIDLSSLTKSSGSYTGATAGVPFQMNICAQLNVSDASCSSSCICAFAATEISLGVWGAAPPVWSVLAGPGGVYQGVSLTFTNAEPEACKQLNPSVNFTERVLTNTTVVVALQCVNSGQTYSYFTVSQARSNPCFYTFTMYTPAACIPPSPGSNNPLLLYNSMGAGALLLCVIVFFVAYVIRHRRKIHEMRTNLDDRLDQQRRWKDIGDGEINLGPPIGEGASSIVYRANWHGTEVAVKWMKNQQQTTANLRVFEEEISVNKHLPDHPRILLFLGACSKPGKLMAVLQMMECGSVEEWIIHKQKFPLAFDLPPTQFHRNLLRVMQIAVDASAGLYHCHCEHVIHRDVRAANFLLTVDNGQYRATIGDFGLSRILARGQDRGITGREEKVPLLWSAPEGNIYGVYNRKTDVYMFGMFLFELFARQEPFEGMNIMTFARFPPDVLSKLRPDMASLDKCPTDVITIIQQCWQENAQIRPEMKQVNTLLQGVFDICRRTPAEDAVKLFTTTPNADGKPTEGKAWSAPSASSSLPEGKSSEGKSSEGRRGVSLANGGGGGGGGENYFFPQPSLEQHQQPTPAAAATRRQKDPSAAYLKLKTLAHHRDDSNGNSGGSHYRSDSGDDDSSSTRDDFGSEPGSESSNGNSSDVYARNYAVYKPTDKIGSGGNNNKDSKAKKDAKDPSRHYGGYGQMMTMSKAPIPMKDMSKQPLLGSEGGSDD